MSLRRLSMVCGAFFFFKQKTAYELRISDWSSDVCSSDLVAFVATIYGVGIANIFLLPAAGKLKFKHRQVMILKEMMLEGVLGILEGQNPRLIEGDRKSVV